MLSQILVVSGTASGQTAKISRFIVDTLTNRGELPILIDGDNVPRDLSLEHFDGVIIGASVTRGRYQPCVRRFVAQYRDALDTMPSAFFCASGSAATPDARGRGEARACIDDFLRETGWHPALIESLAGVIAFTKYNPFVRWILKQISKRNGGPTDTSRDHEFTDWSPVAEGVRAGPPSRVRVRHRAVDKLRLRDAECAAGDVLFQLVRQRMRLRQRPSFFTSAEEDWSCVERPLPLHSDARRELVGAGDALADRDAVRGRARTRQAVPVRPAA